MRVYYSKPAAMLVLTTNKYSMTTTQMLHAIQGEFIPSANIHRPKFESGIYKYDGNYRLHLKDADTKKPVRISPQLIGIFKDELKKAGFPYANVGYDSLNQGSVALIGIKRIDTRHFLPAFAKAVNKYQSLL